MLQLSPPLGAEGQAPPPAPPRPAAPLARPPRVLHAPRAPPTASFHVHDAVLRIFLRKKPRRPPCSLYASLPQSPIRMAPRFPNLPLPAFLPSVHKLGAGSSVASHHVVTLAQRRLPKTMDCISASIFLTCGPILTKIFNWLSEMRPRALESTRSGYKSKGNT